MSSIPSTSRIMPLPSKTTIYACAGLYVLSGICQPMIMTLCKYSGLAANPTAQLYMFFYYLGPALVVVPVLLCDNSVDNKTTTTTTTNTPGSSSSGSSSMHNKSIIISSSIAMFDIVASAMNYTGASLAGPTVFAIVYSSVTIWTAVFSRLFLKRRMQIGQWIAVFTVFGGLCVTASNSTELGPDITKGTILVVVGSMMHGGTYCMNEAIMTTGVTQQTLSVKQNTAIQGCTAAFVMGIWQLVYTVPRYDELIKQPMREAGTSLTTALVILLSFMVANLIHSVTYYHTLKFYAGGATSAGAFKGLQAVLVFVAAHVLYCNHYNIGGTEMCFSQTKLISLVTVCGGVAVYGYLTEKQQQQQQDQQQQPQWQSVPSSSSSSSSPLSCLRSLFRLHNNKKQGYMTIPHGYDDEDEGDNGNGGGIVEVETMHV